MLSPALSLSSRTWKQKRKCLSQWRHNMGMSVCIRVCACVCMPRSLGLLNYLPVPLHVSTCLRLFSRASLCPRPLQPVAPHPDGYSPHSLAVFTSAHLFSLPVNSDTPQAAMTSQGAVLPAFLLWAIGPASLPHQLGLSWADFPAAPSLLQGSRVLPAIPPLRHALGLHA